jgi:hypothetical protein
MAREMNAFFAPRLADLGQYGLSPDGITAAGIIPAIVLEMPKFENAALGLADVTTAFQLISRKALWEVLCALEDSRNKVRLQRKLLALYSGTNFDYYLLEDGPARNDVGCQHQGGSDARVQLRHSTVQPGICDAGLEATARGREFKGQPVVAICVHDDSAHLGDPNLVCRTRMMTRTMELGRTNLALKYGEAKKQLYQSKRTGTQTSNDTDVDVIRLRHEGTGQNPAGWGQSEITEIRRNHSRRP